VSDQPILLDQGDDVTAVGLGVTIGERDLTIGVSSPLRPVRDSIDAMTRLFLIVVPALTLLIAGGTWFLVGRALRPVSTITTHVDRITTHNLEERVPETVSTDEIGHLARTMTNASSSVVVTIAVDETHAVVSIADDGPGIPDAELDRIFERFTRLDDPRNRSDGGGAGLGLAITKQIVSAHNGTITATNPTSGGAPFTLTLPFIGIAAQPDKRFRGTVFCCWSSGLCCHTLDVLLLWNQQLSEVGWYGFGWYG
jgi:nitrogen fixation/metabolism regulation signal transduction histidine kinase